jgi:hypothetical protein
MEYFRTLDQPGVQISVELINVKEPPHSEGLFSSEHFFKAFKRNMKKRRSLFYTLQLDFRFNKFSQPIMLEHGTRFQVEIKRRHQIRGTDPIPKVVNSRFHIDR